MISIWQNQCRKNMNIHECNAIDTENFLRKTGRVSMTCRGVIIGFVWCDCVKLFNCPLRLGGLTFVVYIFLRRPSPEDFLVCDSPPCDFPLFFRFEWASCARSKTSTLQFLIAMKPFPRTTARLRSTEQFSTPSPCRSARLRFNRTNAHTYVVYQNPYQIAGWAVHKELYRMCNEVAVT